MFGIFILTFHYVEENFLVLKLTYKIHLQFMFVFFLPIDVVRFPVSRSKILHDSKSKKPNKSKQKKNLNIALLSTNTTKLDLLFIAL